MTFQKQKSTLEQLYAAMDKVNAQKPLNFWEKPNWAENLQNYGTTDESVIKNPGSDLLRMWKKSKAWRHMRRII